MPALVNIRVGSLRGTSGEDDTISWPLSAKNLRKVDLISLTPLIKRPIAKLPKGALCRDAFRQGYRCCPETVQRHQRVALIAYDLTLIVARARVERLGAALFFAYLPESHVGRDRPKGRRRRSNRPGNSQANGPRDVDTSGKRRLT